MRRAADEAQGHDGFRDARLDDEEGWETDYEGGETDDDKGVGPCDFV